MNERNDYIIIILIIIIVVIIGLIGVQAEITSET